jgi:hypothetical protein
MKHTKFRSTGAGIVLKYLTDLLEAMKTKNTKKMLVSF